MADSFNPKQASATSASPAGSSASVSLAGECPQMRLLWKPTAGGVANIRWGKGAQTAVSTDLAMDAVTETFSKQDADTLAVIGTGTLYVICGTGD